MDTITKNWLLEIYKTIEESVICINC